MSLLVGPGVRWPPAALGALRMVLGLYAGLAIRADDGFRFHGQDSIRFAVLFTL